MAETKEEAEVEPRTEPAPDPVPDQLYTYGLSGEPVRWVAAHWQPVVTALRAANVGELTAADVQPLLDVTFPDAGYQAADLVVTGTPTGTFTFAEDVDVTFTSDDAGLNLPDSHISWDFGDEGKGNGATVTHAYAAPGTYTVSHETVIAGRVYASRQDVDVDLVAEPPPPEGDAPEADEELFDPADHTVDEVLKYADANPDDVPDLIDVEEQGKARVTLLEKLNAMSDDED